MSRSVSSVKVTMNNAASSNVLVGQKVRLLGVQYYTKDNVGGADTGIEDRDIRLQDSAGNDLFRFAILSRVFPFICFLDDEVLSVFELA